VSGEADPSRPESLHHFRASIIPAACSAASDDRAAVFLMSILAGRSRRSEWAWFNSPLVWVVVATGQVLGPVEERCEDAGAVPSVTTLATEGQLAWISAARAAASAEAGDGTGSWARVCGPGCRRGRPAAAWPARWRRSGQGGPGLVYRHRLGGRPADATIFPILTHLRPGHGPGAGLPYRRLACQQQQVGDCKGVPSAVFTIEQDELNAGVRAARGERRPTWLRPDASCLPAGRCSKPFRSVTCAPSTRHLWWPHFQSV
jgi:hypothetical protein